MNHRLLAAFFFFSLSLISLSCSRTGSPISETRGTQVEEKNIEKQVYKEAWEREWKDTLFAARKEGKLLLYCSGGPETIKKLIEIFRQKFGLEMDYVIGKGGQVAAKVMAERMAGLYLFDLWVGGTSGIVETFEPAGALEPLNPALILPEVKDPNKWYGGKLSYLTEKEMALTFSGSIKHTLLFNTNLVRRDEISSYWDLLQPKWKEKIVYFDPTISGGGNSFFRAASTKITGLDYFKELAKQKPEIIQDNRLIVEWVARGKYPIALGVSSEVVTEFMNAGAPLDLSTPKEGTYLSSSGGNVALMNKAPHPNAARVFINFLLSKEGQDIWAVNEGVQSLRLDSTVEHLKPEDRRQPGVSYINPDIGDMLRDKQKYIESAREIFAPLMKAR